MQYRFDTKQYLKNTWPIYLIIWLLIWGFTAMGVIHIGSGAAAAIGLIGCFAFIVIGLTAINRIRTWRSSKLTVSRNQIVFHKTIEDGYEGEAVLGRRHKFRIYSIATESIVAKPIGSWLKVTGEIICEEEVLKSGHYSRTQKDHIRSIIIPPYWEQWELGLKKYILDVSNQNTCT